jgi:hypothetical protein
MLKFIQYLEFNNPLPQSSSGYSVGHDFESNLDRALYLLITYHYSWQKHLAKDDFNQSDAVADLFKYVREYLPQATDDDILQMARKVKDAVSSVHGYGKTIPSITLSVKPWRGSREGQIVSKLKAQITRPDPSLN